jgi:hypothetical protein
MTFQTRTDIRVNGTKTASVNDVFTQEHLSRLEKQIKMTNFYLRVMSDVKIDKKDMD